MTDERQRGRLLRDAITIVVTGIVLGIAYNQLALAHRPPRGLAWIAQPATLASVESLGAGDSAAAGPTVPDPATPVTSDPSPATGARGRATVTGPSSLPRGADASRGTAAMAPPASAPTPSNPPPPARAPDLPEIPDARTPLRIELANVKRFVDARAALIIDAREAPEFAAGHLPGAINISLDDASRDPDRLENLDAKGMPIIVYCGGGNCEASRMLAESLMRDYRKKRVLVYEGGYPEWSGAGYPVAR